MNKKEEKRRLAIVEAETKRGSLVVGVMNVMTLGELVNRLTDQGKLPRGYATRLIGEGSTLVNGIVCLQPTHRLNPADFVAIRPFDGLRTSDVGGVRTLRAEN